MANRTLRGLPAALILVAACSNASDGDAVPDGEATSAPAAVSVIDAEGRTVQLPGPATRILSLVPSVTQTLHSIGATELLVGRTDYDTLSAIAELPSVGGGVGPNLEVIRTLEPDLVITFAGESDARTRDGLQALGIRSFAVRPDRLADVGPIIRRLGALTGREAAAEFVAREMYLQLSAAREATRDLDPVSVIYLLGGSPPLVAGPETFISDLIQLAGGTNVFADLGELYAPVSPEALLVREADVLLVAQGSDVEERLRAGRRVVSIPSWVEIPGPNMGRSAWFIVRALHPDLFEDGL
jgi:iron complex transport system substrate-binding protein